MRVEKGSDRERRFTLDCEGPYGPASKTDFVKRKLLPKAASLPREGAKGREAVRAR